MKEKIAILADSACDLPVEFVNQYNISILPLRIIYPDKEYIDGIDIHPDDVYDRMPGQIPTTSMPSIHDIKTALEKIHHEGFTHVLSMHLSSGLSGTMDAVRMVAREFDNMIIKVFDTKTLSIGTGWMVLDAARNIAKGFCFEHIIEKLHKLQPNVQVYYVLDTLDYLRKGGRIGLVAGMLGNLMDLKPIISINEDGKYFTFCKTRGRKKSIDKLVSIVEETVKTRIINLAVLQGGAKQEHAGLLEKLKNLPNINELISANISPTLGVHTGPGLLGIAFHEI